MERRRSCYYVIVHGFYPEPVREFTDLQQALIFMQLFVSASLVYGSIINDRYIIVQEIPAKS